MDNGRTEKIRGLKANIKGTNDSIAELVKELINTEDVDRKKELQEAIVSRKDTVAELKESLVMTRMNKLDSSFFEWLPHKGMNRKQARAFRRMRK